MNVRVLLQTELWSKRTTRRIFTVFALAVAVCGTCFWIDRVWITHGERQSARGALTLIDSLELASEETDQADFEARVKKAERAMDSAEAVALTTRDRQITIALFSILRLIELDREQWNSDKSFEERHKLLKDSDSASEAKARKATREARHLIESSLRHTLGD